jgi:hypothetical protein
MYMLMLMRRRREGNGEFGLFMEITIRGRVRLDCFVASRLPMTGSAFPFRHCEERSDEAIQRCV